jgi:hypothetical protein
MACNAVATAQVQIAEDHLRQYLTPTNIEAPLMAYLKARFPTAAINNSQRQSERTWTITEGYNQTTITVREGQVVTRNYQQDYAAAQALSQEIAQMLLVIGATYWQQATAQFLEQNCAVIDRTITADGSLVIRLRV